MRKPKKSPKLPACGDAPYLSYISSLTGTAPLKAECSGNRAVMSPAGQIRCDVLAARNAADFQHAEELGWA